MSITKDVKDAIAKNLPEMAANELKEFIAQAEDTKRSLEGVRNLNERYSEKLAELQKQNAQLERNSKTTVELIEQELKLEARERALNVYAAELKTHWAEASKQELFDLVNVIFKNQALARTLTGNIPCYVPPSVGNNNTGYVTNYNTSTTEMESIV